MGVSERNPMIHLSLVLLLLSSLYNSGIAQSPGVDIDFSLADEAANRVIFHGETNITLTCEVSGLSNEPIFIFKHDGDIIYTSLVGLVQMFSEKYSVSQEDNSVHLTIKSFNNNTDGAYECLALHNGSAYTVSYRVSASESSPQCRLDAGGGDTSSENYSQSLECFYKDESDQLYSEWERINSTGRDGELPSHEITLGVKKKRTASVDYASITGENVTYRCIVIHKLSKIFPRRSCDIEIHGRKLLTTLQSVTAGRNGFPTDLTTGTPHSTSMHHTSSNGFSGTQERTNFTSFAEYTSIATAITDETSANSSLFTEGSESVTAASQPVAMTTSGPDVDDDNGQQLTTPATGPMVSESIDIDSGAVLGFTTTDVPPDRMTSVETTTPFDIIATTVGLDSEGISGDFLQAILYYFVPFFAVVVLILVILPLVCICGRRKPEVRLLRDYSAKSTTSLYGASPATNPLESETVLSVATAEREEGDGENGENNNSKSGEASQTKQAEKKDEVPEEDELRAIENVYNDPANTWIQSTHL